MQPDEAWLLKNYDSAALGRVRFGVHCAFDDPTPWGYVPARELQAVQLLLGHSKLESTVRYLGSTTLSKWRNRRRRSANGPVAERTLTGHEPPLIVSR